MAAPKVTTWPRRVAVTTALAVAALVLPSCQTDSVRIAFRPPPGQLFRYEVRVAAEAVTRLIDQPERRTTSEFLLHADHQVVRNVGATTEVRVRLRVEGEPATTLLVRLDRAAQLADIAQIEGLPSDVLGRLGLSEIFPAAAGAPPDRALAPGERWVIDDPVRLAGGASTRLKGYGRLVELDVVDGRDVATVDSSYQLPVRRLAPDDPTVVLLEGRQTTVSTARHDLGDGAIQWARSRSHGAFDVTVRPPAGEIAPPAHGTLTLDVRSVTRRLR